MITARRNEARERKSDLDNHLAEFFSDTDGNIGEAGAGLDAVCAIMSGLRGCSSDSSGNSGGASLRDSILLFSNKLCKASCKEESSSTGCS